MKYCIPHFEEGVFERLEVRSFSDYKRYRPGVRYDFWFCCAYCMMSEVEARGIGFQIDHYRPHGLKKYKRLKNQYANLVYSCERCNSIKSSYNPEDKNGNRRVLRPDEDDFRLHYEVRPIEESGGVELLPTTEIAGRTLELIDFSRHPAKKVWMTRLLLANASIELREADRLPIDTKEYRRRVQVLRQSIDGLIAKSGGGGATKARRLGTPSCHRCLAP